MQTRKRAKSVMFGKKAKEKKEKEALKEIPEEKTVAADEEKTSEKAEVVERRVVPEKPQSDELSATPPSEEPETESAPTVATPSNEFMTDTPLSATPDAPKVTSIEAAVPPAENAELTPAATPETDTPSTADTTAQPTASPGEFVQPGSSQELSSTLPPSAFTIQSEEGEEAKKPDEGIETGSHKRFGVYFFVVAFLAFILGLGAMAAASYFGLVNTHLPFSSGVHVGTLLGAKPTPTTPPPPPSPTQKPVDLTAFTVSVLNGSGVSGKAAAVKTTLTTAGFKVTSTGNADNNNFTKTEIAAKKTVDPAFLTKLEVELNKSYVVDTNVTTAPASSTADVVVTLGSTTAQ